MYSICIHARGDCGQNLVEKAIINSLSQTRWIDCVYQTRPLYATRRPESKGRCSRASLMELSGYKLLYADFAVQQRLVPHGIFNTDNTIAFNMYTCESAPGAFKFRPMLSIIFRYICLYISYTNLPAFLNPCIYGTSMFCKLIIDNHVQY